MKREKRRGREGGKDREEKRAGEGEPERSKERTYRGGRGGMQQAGKRKEETQSHLQEEGTENGRAMWWWERSARAQGGLRAGWSPG